jgi:hypothetical protein
MGVVESRASSPRRESWVKRARCSSFESTTRDSGAGALPLWEILLVEGVLARDKAHVYTEVRWKRARRSRRKGLKRSGWPGK